MVFSFILFCFSFISAFDSHLQRRSRCRKNMNTTKIRLQVTSANRRDARLTSAPLAVARSQALDVEIAFCFALLLHLLMLRVSCADALLLYCCDTLKNICVFIFCCVRRLFRYLLRSQAAGVWRPRCACRADGTPQAFCSARA